MSCFLTPLYASAITRTLTSFHFAWLFRHSTVKPTCMSFTIHRTTFSQSIAPSGCIGCRFSSSSFTASVVAWSSLLRDFVIKSSQPAESQKTFCCITTITLCRMRHYVTWNKFAVEITSSNSNDRSSPRNIWNFASVTPKHCPMFFHTACRLAINSGSFNFVLFLIGFIYKFY